MVNIKKPGNNRSTTDGNKKTENMGEKSTICEKISLKNSKEENKMEISNNTKEENKMENNEMEKKNNITEMVFILDRSGSMCGLETDTIGGFNSMIKEQKEKDGKCYISTVLFNDHSKVIHDRADLSTIKDMTEKDYRTSGSTALVDALGDAIHHIGNVHKYARKEDVPANTIFVITTDGMENASHKYTSDRVKSMIERQKEKYGWEFVFVGANIDAVETAKAYGIGASRAVNYHCDHIGTETVYKNISAMMCSVRTTGAVEDDWKEEIDKDFKNRKK